MVQKCWDYQKLNAQFFGHACRVLEHPNHGITHQILWCHWREKLVRTSVRRIISGTKTRRRSLPDTCMLLGGSDEVKKQFLKNVITCFNCLTTSDLFNWNAKREKLAAAKAPNCIRRRVSIPTSAQKNRTNTFSSDIGKTNGIDRSFSHKI